MEEKDESKIYYSQVAQKTSKGYWSWAMPL